MILKRIAIQYISGCIFGAMGFICFTAIAAMLQTMFLTEVFFGGDKSIVFSGLFLGIPIGALVGLTIINRHVFRAKGWNAFGLVVGFVIAQVGILLGLYLMDTLGSMIGALLCLFETVFLIFIGYRVGGTLFKVKKRNLIGRDISRF